MSTEQTAESGGRSERLRCTCLRALPPRGAGYRPASPCPRHGRPQRQVPPIPPTGRGGGSPDVIGGGNEWEEAVLATALERCLAHRTPRQRALWTRRPCLACLLATVKPRLVTPAGSTDPIEGLGSQKHTPPRTPPAQSGGPS